MQRSSVEVPSAPGAGVDGGESRDARLVYPATQRNREPILEVLRRVLPRQGLVLELAAGSGEHALFFAAALPGLVWQPTDCAPECLASIRAWQEELPLPNLRPPLPLDVTEAVWPVTEANAIVCINMLHITPWGACEALMSGAARLLEPGSVLYLYGPFKVRGAHTSESNAAFDASLQLRDRRWGVRDVADVARVARQNGLETEEQVAMPANNLSLILRRR